MNGTDRMRLAMRNMCRMEHRLNRVRSARLVGFFIYVTGLILFLLIPVSLGLLALVMMFVGAADWLICAIAARVIDKRLEREEDLYVWLDAEGERRDTYHYVE